MEPDPIDMDWLIGYLAEFAPDYLQPILDAQPLSNGRIPIYHSATRFDIYTDEDRLGHLTS